MIKIFDIDDRAVISCLERVYLKYTCIHHITICRIVKCRVCAAKPFAYVRQLGKSALIFGFPPFFFFLGHKKLLVLFSLLYSELSGFKHLQRDITMIKGMNKAHNRTRRTSPAERSLKRQVGLNVKSYYMIRIHSLFRRAGRSVKANIVRRRGQMEICPRFACNFIKCIIYYII